MPNIKLLEEEIRYLKRAEGDKQFPPKYRKIPNISPGLVEVRKTFLGDLYSEGHIFGGHFVKTSKFIVIYSYYRQKWCFFRPKSPLKSS